MSNLTEAKKNGTSPSVLGNGEKQEQNKYQSGVPGGRRVHKRGEGVVRN